jgi:hypothetical protein
MKEIISKDHVEEVGAWGSFSDDLLKNGER